MRRINWLRVLHWVIIINFALGILYGSYLVLFVFGEGGLPLFRRVTRTPLELIVKRRLYSVEIWVAISGLSIYLALTEILPRRVAKWLERNPANPGVGESPPVEPDP